MYKRKRDENFHWISVSDLMSGLMIVFLFISVAYMRYNQIEKDKIKNIAVAYQDTQVAIYYSLLKEFEHDMDKWNASITQDTLSFQFNAPEVLFNTGESEINQYFQSILSDFIPRYLHILEQYKNSIEEIRIEGHTSSEWRYKTDEDDAYFLNMELSQSRTRSVLKYIYSLLSITDEQKKWIKDKFAAVGFSSSKAIYNNGVENKERSRRVTFRIITNSDIEIKKIVTGS